MAQSTPSLSEKNPSTETPDDLRFRIAASEQRVAALETELARREGLEDTLQRREAELTDFVENAAEGLHQVAGDGTILWANRAELELLGYQAENYIGRHIAEFHVDAPVINAMLEALSAGKTLNEQPARLRCADGSIKHVLINSNGCFQNGELRYTRCLTRDATDRVTRQTAQDQLHATLVNSPIATALLVGPDHIIKIANTRYTDVVRQGNLEGVRIADTLPVHDGHELIRALNETYATGQSFAANEIALELQAESGMERRVFSINLEPLRDINGAVEGIIISLVDLTPHVRNRQALQNSLNERNNLLVQLEEASRAKDEFLAMLGHELRNPLAPIVTALQLMRMRGETGTEREQAVIQRQVDHLIQLIADLLDISKVTRGMIDLRKEWISVSQVLTKAVEMASPLFEQRSHRLYVNATEQIHVHGDSVRLAQVISNLLSNAARYTPTGGEIHLAAQRDGDDHIVISVRDNGIGIAPDLLPRVFGLFFQGARDGGRLDGGLGIGLALVKSFVELHGGTVRVHSDGLGFGSEFSIRLPISASGELRPTSTSTPPVHCESQAQSPLRILIVDDNVDAAETLSYLLKAFGHIVDVVNCPTDALQKARKYIPDVAILDIGLPVMDGYELRAELTRSSDWAKCVFVALSGYGQAKDIECSQAAGFTRHFVKPIDPQALFSFLDEVNAATTATISAPRLQ